MSGQFLRRGTPPAERHQCALPKLAYRGDVWACTCGRRWTCTADYIVWEFDGDDDHDPQPFVENAQWERRSWPWPRAPRRSTPGSDTVDRIEQTGHPSGGSTDR